jgi:hypothetical protein
VTALDHYEHIRTGGSCWAPVRPKAGLYFLGTSTRLVPPSTHQPGFNTKRMARTFSFDQLSQPGGFGRFARGMTYGLVAVCFAVALVFAFLILGWLVTGPIELATYGRAPRCTGAFTDSCRGFATGQITRASVSGGQTDFDVTVSGHSYATNLTENSAPDLAAGQELMVEVWQGAVVAITLPDGERVITGSDPEWQASNYVLPIVGVIMVPFLSIVGFQQFRSAHRAGRVARQSAARPSALPAKVVEFGDSLLAQSSRSLHGGDMVIRPSVQPGTAFQQKNVWVAAFALLVLALPIGFALAGGGVPTSGRAAGAFFGSLTVLPLLVVLLVALLIYRQLFLRNARLESTAGTLRVRDWAAREQTWPVSSIGGLLLISIRPAGSSRGERRLVILEKNERALANLNGAFFAAVAIENLGERLGSPVLADMSDPVDASALNQRFPGSATWLELHPGLAGAGLVMILISAGLIVWLISRMF